MKRFGNAIGNDDFRSSTWLRIEDFQQHDCAGGIRLAGFAVMVFAGAWYYTDPSPTRVSEMPTAHRARLE
jgi:hypothetical protein